MDAAARSDKDPRRSLPGVLSVASPAAAGELLGPRRPGCLRVEGSHFDETFTTPWR
jgi:hypothetical protein